jgi:hypothetical protein
MARILRIVANLDRVTGAVAHVQVAGELDRLPAGGDEAHHRVVAPTGLPAGHGVDTDHHPVGMPIRRRGIPEVHQVPHSEDHEHKAHRQEQAD